MGDRAWSGAGWALLIACGASHSTPTAPLGGSAAAPASSAPATSPVPSPAATAGAPGANAPRADPVLLVTEPQALALLERQGLALGDWFLGDGTGTASNAALAASPRYGSITKVLARDVAEVQQHDAQAGVNVARYPHRLFDVRWLTAGEARFELIGVVNRPDRRPFDLERSCGEIRLVYRLAYRRTAADGTPIASRLPMTLGIELAPPSSTSDCARDAGAWVPPGPLAGEELARWLVSTSGPLSPPSTGTRLAVPHRIVVNLQQVRWPSAVRPDLGGHAEYLLRSFRSADGAGVYEPEPLENTPDTALLARSPKLKAGLVAYLTDATHVAELSDGVPLVPREFLATRAISVTPRGLSRRQNRPFSALFTDGELAHADFSRSARVRSASALLRRLDELSCPGCHESRSIAGFHLLGEDPADTPAGNALTGGTSPHLLGELPRRAAFARSLLEPAPHDPSPPFAERSSYEGYGAHCGLGTDATYAAWSCAPGLTCQAYDAPASEGVGQCLPPAPGAAGDPCEVGPVKAAANPHQDRVVAPSRLDCGANAACNVDAVGFPGGMCTEGCGALSPSSRCGAIAVLDPFNACIARGEPFSACLRDHVRPAGLRGCDAQNPCRDDYICARTAEGGTCIPPYFLFQLRVDGHP